MPDLEMICSKLRDKWLITHNKTDLSECTGDEMAECLQWVDLMLGELILCTKS